MAAESVRSGPCPVPERIKIEAEQFQLRSDVIFPYGLPGGTGGKKCGYLRGEPGDIAAQTGDNGI